MNWGRGGRGGEVLGSCLRRNDGGGGGGVSVGWWLLGTPTPHLTSPLEGGRDELGRGRVLGWVGSCLRRNDGEGRV